MTKLLVLQKNMLANQQTLHCTVKNYQVNWFFFCYEYFLLNFSTLFSKSRQVKKSLQ